MRTTLFFIAIVSILGSSAQVLPNTFTGRIDSIFKEFDQTTPGCAISIVRNDSVIFSKGYGMANLEHEMPITSESLFDIASVSKQFTGMGIALLAREGKLDLEEDIRKYIPWVPDFKQRITVKNLLHHTSGIRDYIIMSLLGGISVDAPQPQEGALKYIKNFEALNFTPGDNHNYSNSNYILLAEIIQVASGKTFNEFMDSALFKPLAMNRSFFDQKRATKERVSSYIKSDNNFTKVLTMDYSYGDGGLFTTVNDLAKWMFNFFYPIVGDAAIVQQLTAPSKLNNGKKNSYGMGIGTLDFKGYKQYTHSGSSSGFRSTISIFPELNIGIVVLSNYAMARPGAKAKQVIDLYLKEYAGLETNLPVVPQKNSLSDTVFAKNISGYYMAENGTRLTFGYKDGKLFQDNQLLLEKTSKEFVLASDTTVTFSFGIKGKDTSIQHYSWGTNYLLKKYQVDSSFTTNMLNDYTGTYYNKELDRTFTISVKYGRLQLSNFLLGEIWLQPFTKDDLFFKGGVSHLKMKRDPKQKIYAFDFSNGSVTKLRFVKLCKSH